MSNSNRTYSIVECLKKSVMKVRKTITKWTAFSKCLHDNKMHTDLSKQLHSEDCNALILRLAACHKENSFGKFVGVCNSIDSELNRCLKKERLARREKNAEQYKASREKRRKEFHDDKS